jgi:ribosomal protein S18 acetylase RimI-like enzyme
MSLSIRRAQPADAGNLARFAARTFFETYADANDPADMAQHLSAKYSEAIQDGEIRNPMGVYLLAELEGELAGYAYLLFQHAPEGVALDRPIELVRFYVAREWHGRGVAQALMAACVAEARRRGGRTLWLAVWQQNDRAISFYRKAGFDRAGTVHFRLGSQLQDDHLMTLALDPVGSIEPVAPR